MNTRLIAKHLSETTPHRRLSQQTPERITDAFWNGIGWAVAFLILACAWPFVSYWLRGIL